MSPNSGFLLNRKIQTPTFPVRHFQRCSFSVPKYQNPSQSCYTDQLLCHLGKQNTLQVLKFIVFYHFDCSPQLHYLSGRMDYRILSLLILCSKLNKRSKKINIFYLPPFIPYLQHIEPKKMPLFICNTNYNFRLR